ncbi:hypothetical protein JCM30471_17810 [Desulfuromonas carbonis]
MNLSSTSTRWLLIAGIALLLVSSSALFLLFRTPESPELPAPSPVTTPAPAGREVILYFGAADGTHLVAEQRELAGCRDDQACLRATLEALLAGPVGDGVPILPEQTVVRDLTLADQGLASVNFSSELIAGHPGGSMTELLTVYGIVDTLAVNFPYLRQVRFLVEGEPVATLKGHVDLRQPLAPDFSLTRPPLAGNAATPASARKEP